MGEISVAEAQAYYDAEATFGDFVQKELSLHDFEPKLVKTGAKDHSR